MARYLLTVVEPTGDSVPEPDVLAAIMRDVDAVDREMREAGVWLFAGGLFPPDTATVVRWSDGETMLTDGPFAEGKEYVGGLWIVRVPALADALGYARRITAATTLPVEVRPFRG